MYEENVTLNFCFGFCFFLNENITLGYIKFIADLLLGGLCPFNLIVILTRSTSLHVIWQQSLVQTYINIRA